MGGRERAQYLPYEGKREEGEGSFHHKIREPGRAIKDKRKIDNAREGEVWSEP